MFKYFILFAALMVIVACCEKGVKANKLPTADPIVEFSNCYFKICKYETLNEVCYVTYRGSGIAMSCVRK